MQIFCEFASNFLEKRVQTTQKSCEKPANRRAASDEKPTQGVLAVGFCNKGVSKHELKFDNQLAELVELTIRLPNCA